MSPNFSPDHSVSSPMTSGFVVTVILLLSMNSASQWQPFLAEMGGKKHERISCCPNMMVFVRSQWVIILCLKPWLVCRQWSSSVGCLTHFGTSASYVCQNGLTIIYTESGEYDTSKWIMFSHSCKQAEVANSLICRRYRHFSGAVNNNRWCWHWFKEGDSSCLSWQWVSFTEI